MTIPIGAVVAAAATLAAAGAVAGALAPERLRRVVAEHPARTTACVMVPLTASVAMAIAHSVVRARQGTCPQPLSTGADGASTSLCEVAAPWLQAWAAGLGAIALLVGGIAIGTLLRASCEERRARSTAG